jgi:hypothetical protein
VTAGEALRRFFFEPRSVRPMAAVRVVWGALIAVWGLTLLPDVDPFLTDGALRYERTPPAGMWNPLDWVGWDGAPMAVCLLLVAAGAATALGWRTRASSVVAVLCLLSLQRANPSVFNSGDLLMRQIGIAVALSPAGLVWSLDARRRSGSLVPAGAELLRAPWAMRLLQLQLCLGYFLSAWAKVRGETWHDGTALGLSLRITDLQRLTPPEWLFDQSVLLNLMAWGTLAFEAAFGALVWNRRLRPWVLGIGVAFHLGIDVFLDVGFFSMAIWCCYLTWVPAERLGAVPGLHAGGPAPLSGSGAGAGGPATQAAPPPPGGRAGGGGPPPR